MKLSMFLGDKKFYRYVIGIALPIMLQNAINTFVNLLDNIMIGNVGAAQLSAVAISNQLIFVFNLCVFGIVSGAGIFTAQFYGKNDVKGVRDTMRLKLIMSAAITVLFIGVILLFDKEIISIWLNDTENPEKVALTLSEAHNYIRIVLIGLIPAFVTQCYADTLRASGDTKVPMRASVVSLAINVVFNYLLIFDHFGYKGLGVIGAAIATSLARFGEVAYIVIWTHHNKHEYPFVEGLYKTFRVPVSLFRSVVKKGLPLMLNESLWGLGITALNSCYSMRGLEAVEATSISSTIVNVFNVAMLATGSTVGIVIGRILGSGDMKKARDYDNKLITFSVAVSTVAGIFLFFSSSIATLPYNVSDETARIATELMRVSAILMPIHGFVHASYFTLRSGGKTLSTFLFDSGFVWTVAVPLGFVIGKFTNVPIVAFTFICQAIDIIKCIVGFILVKGGSWLNNIVSK